MRNDYDPSWEERWLAEYIDSPWQLLGVAVFLVALAVFAGWCLGAL